MTEHVFGVVHGEYTHFGGIILESRFPIIDDHAIREAIDNLPKGGSVGIEAFPELKDRTNDVFATNRRDYSDDEGILDEDSEEEAMFSDTYEEEDPLIEFNYKGQAVSFNRVDLQYWAFWLQYLEMNRPDIDIIFLDSLSLHLKRKNLLEGMANAYEQRALPGELVDFPWTSEDDQSDRHNRAWCYAQAAEYSQFFEREAYMLERMRQQNPDITIMGVGHTEELMTEPAAMFQNNLVGVNYTRCIPPNLDLGKSMVERELVRRRYNIATQRRVLPEKKPDFIGSFYPESRSIEGCTAAGLFEVYVTQKGENGSLQGYIEDGLGTATFTGSLQNDEFTFDKKYLSEKADVYSYTDGIEYAGIKRDGVYRGVWVAENRLMADGGPFILFEGEVFPEKY